MTEFSEMYRLMDQALAIFMIMVVVLAFVAIYPYFDKYRRTENYKLEQKLRQQRYLKRNQQKHERQMARIKAKARK